jgi:hypothetical protein
MSRITVSILNLPVTTCTFAQSEVGQCRTDSILADLIAVKRLFGEASDIELTFKLHVERGKVRGSGQRCVTFTRATTVGDKLHRSRSSVMRSDMSAARWVR